MHLSLHSGYYIPVNTPFRLTGNRRGGRPNSLTQLRREGGPAGDSGGALYVSPDEERIGRGPPVRNIDRLEAQSQVISCQVTSVSASGTASRLTVMHGRLGRFRYGWQL